MTVMVTGMIECDCESEYDECDCEDGVEEVQL